MPDVVGGGGICAGEGRPEACIADVTFEPVLAPAELAGMTAVHDGVETMPVWWLVVETGGRFVYDQSGDAWNGTRG